MKAADIKEALRGRHPAVTEGAPGPWTCLEEWMNIDLLAVSAWASVRPYPRYGRVGYEVKVSRADYHRELARPDKRAAAVGFCHEFYFAVPRGLLTSTEMSWAPPPGFNDEPHPFDPMRCPGAYGAWCTNGRVTFGRGPLRDRYGHDRFYGSPEWMESAARRAALRDTYRHVYSGECPTCRGTGALAPPPAHRARAPYLWVPDDVGLVLIREDGYVITAKRAPRRDPRPVDLNDMNLAQLIRWVSVRPDPRHAEISRRR